MSVFMRAVLDEWNSPPFDELRRFVEDRCEYRVSSPGASWEEFELTLPDGTTVLAADLWTGDAAAEEVAEMRDAAQGLKGTSAARQTVLAHLDRATAIVGMQILMSVYDDAVSAANTVIAYLEQHPGVLTQVDSIGWYEGSDLLLQEEE